ncbi:hypothetical protein Droror1_Dr00003136 [Drosera rotundifolia]
MKIQPPTSIHRRYNNKELHDQTVYTDPYPFMITQPMRLSHATNEQEKFIYLVESENQGKNSYCNQNSSVTLSDDAQTMIKILTAKQRHTQETRLLHFPIDGHNP